MSNSKPDQSSAFPIGAPYPGMNEPLADAEIAAFVARLDEALDSESIPIPPGLSLEEIDAHILRHADNKGA